MRIVYLTCPQCGRQFYIHEEFAEQGYDWFCPFCMHAFKEENAAASGTRKDRPAGAGEHRM